MCEECERKFLIERNTLEQWKKIGKKCLCRVCVNKYKEKVYSVCEQCGKEMVFTYAHQKKLEESGQKLPTICRECKEAGNELVSLGMCEACGKEITQKAYIVSKYRIGRRTLHGECKNKEYVRSFCKVCGDRFTITYGEKEYLENKGYELPKKCKNCRR